MEEGSGLGKFRQLIALLVQESIVAFVPLRNNSTMFLLPMCELTENLGLFDYSSETADSDSSKHSERGWKNFLHVIIITPKVMSSKMNGELLVPCFVRKYTYILPFPDLRDPITYLTVHCHL